MHRCQAESEDLKRHIEELTARLGTLTAENNNLQNRNSLLEKVVQIRGGEASTSSAQVLPHALSAEACASPCMMPWVLA